jgi:hypothetical protein
MRIHLTPKKGSRRFAGAAVAVAALAIMLGLIPAASARSVAQAGPAAAAAPAASTCHWLLTPSSVWVTDPVNRPGLIWDPGYNLPGHRGVAYKVTGQFPHSTTFSFTSYNNLVDIPGSNYVIQDSDFIPDPGSVNPWVPGTLVNGQPRNFTAWFWPDSIPVPAGLQNVVLHSTKPENPGGVARWSLTMRTYKMQPGFTTLAALRAVKITAVSATTLKPVPCPLTPAGAIASQVAGFFAHKKFWGPTLNPPEPTTGNKVYYTRFPSVWGLGLDGYPGTLPNSCASYFVATVPLSKIGVTTVHQVPTFFNNNLVTPTSVMKDYPIRYQSLGVGFFTANQRLYSSLFVNTDDSVYTSDGSWVVVWLPSEPRLTASQEAQVRAVAKALNFNVVQLPPKATGPIARQIPNGIIFLRQKGISPNFGLSNQNAPCWAVNHSYKTYAQQTSPAFFAKYASSPKYNGPYYLDGFRLTFAQFLAQYQK